MTRFTAPQAARIVGITYRQIDHWDRVGAVTATTGSQCGSGARRYYTYDDLLRLRCGRALTEAGIRLHDARHGIAAVSHTVTDGALIGVRRDWRVVPNLNEALDGAYRRAELVNVLPLAAVRADADLGIAAEQLLHILQGEAS